MIITINQYYDSQDHIVNMFGYTDDVAHKNAYGFCYLMNDSVNLKVTLSSLPVDKSVVLLQSSIEIVRPPCVLVDFKYKLDSENFVADGEIVSYQLNYTKNYIIKYLINMSVEPRPV